MMDEPPASLLEDDGLAPPAPGSDPSLPGGDPSLDPAGETGLDLDATQPPTGSSVVVAGGGGGGHQQQLLQVASAEGVRELRTYVLYKDDCEG